MKSSSLLTQAYNKQENIVPNVETPPQPTLLSELKANLWFFIRWFLIGGLTSGIPLAVFVVLYIRKQQGLSTNSSIASSRFGYAATTSFRWNTFGTLVAGQTSSPGVEMNQLNSPFGLTLDRSNALYITDKGNHRIQKYLPTASSGTTVAGQANGMAGSLEVQLNSPGFILVDTNNNIYVTDSGNHRVQLWQNGAPFGRTLAGNGIAGSGLAQFNLARGLTRDSKSDTIYIADFYNNRIVSYTNESSIGTLVAGGNDCGIRSNQLCQPVGVQFDASSNSLYISNYGCHTIVRWTLGADSWTLIAGKPGIAGSSSILLNSPSGFSIDSMGNLYVADTENHRIQFFMPGDVSGTTIAGTTGIAGNHLNQLSSPLAVSIDDDLNVYVADTNNHRVLKFLRSLNY